MSLFSKSNSLNFLFAGMTATEKEMLERIKAEIEQYLLSEPSPDMMKLLVASFNDTNRLGVEESMPVLKNVFSFIRHRLIDGHIVEYKKLVELVDEYMKHCGLRAHVLVGRKKFLDTLYETAKKHSKSFNAPARECVMLVAQCFENWYHSFEEYNEQFPHFREYFVKTRCLGVVVPAGSTQFPIREEKEKDKDKIFVDYIAIVERYPNLLLLAQ